jgi:Metal-dependent amidase/aminoacylase/carboxypeptidase
VFPRHEPYAEMHPDPDLVAAYRRNAEALGRDMHQVPARSGAGSTDMGNVSLALPSIHPAIGIDSLPAVNHQPEFAAHCVTEAADQALYDGAVALAWTAIDAAADEALRSRLLASTQ